MIDNCADSHIIELNVGGKYFTTTRTTLIRHDESMLALIASGEYPTGKDSNGRIFIDRDGDLFRHILNYLRTNKLLVDLNLCELFNLRIEADFYRIEPLIQDIDELILREQEKLTKHEILEEQKLHHYQMQNNQTKFDTIGYHLDLIEHNFLNTNNKRLHIICHYDVFKMLPLLSEDLDKLNNLKQTVLKSAMPYHSADGHCWYLGNDCFEILNISYLTRTQIGHILLQFSSKLLHSNIAYLNSNSNTNSAISLSVYDKWFIPKFVVDKYATIYNNITQRALPPGRTVGYIDWNPNNSNNAD